VLFPTIRFAMFFAVVFPVSWALVPSSQRWKWFMLGASWFFYGSWDWRFIALIALSTGGNQAFAHLVHRAPDGAARRWAVRVAVAANLAVLGYFKYTGFLSDSGSSVLRGFGFDVTPPDVRIVLPVGISFITFQALSYVIDVGRKKLAPASLLDFGVYLAFFPHVVAGPIVRASEFLPQLRVRPDPRKVDVGPAFWLIAAGLFKKVVVASFLADRIVDPLFSSPAQHGGLEALVGIYAYAIQIFADFSGYTDMAIGLAALLGFRFPQNFNSPYVATSVQDFWRRWHMTLSRWLRDYVYIPLGGSRKGRRRTYINVFLTMLLGGLWHGAAWTFVVWGALHGAWQVLERFWRERSPAAVPGASRSTGPLGPDAPRSAGPLGPLTPWVGRLVTFNVVCLGWVFFRADSFRTAGEVLSRLFQPSATPLDMVVPLVVGLMLAAQFVPPDLMGRARGGLAQVHPAVLGLGLAMAVVVVDVLGPEGVAPFIYFKF
jgi:D-alanyl-lipoteichoic acid acyltransferase DltB (MBOAT superfamily)